MVEVFGVFQSSPEAIKNMCQLRRRSLRRHTPRSYRYVPAWPLPIICTSSEYDSKSTSANASGSARPTAMIRGRGGVSHDPCSTPTTDADRSLTVAILEPERLNVHVPLLLLGREAVSVSNPDARGLCLSNRAGGRRPDNAGTHCLAPFLVPSLLAPPVVYAPHGLRRVVGSLRIVVWAAPSAADRRAGL